MGVEIPLGLMDDLTDCKYHCDDDLNLERLEGFSQLVRFILGPRLNSIWISSRSQVLESLLLVLGD